MRRNFACNYIFQLSRLLIHEQKNLKNIFNNMSSYLILLYYMNYRF